MREVISMFSKVLLFTLILLLNLVIFLILYKIGKTCGEKWKTMTYEVTHLLSPTLLSGLLEFDESETNSDFLYHLKIVVIAYAFPKQGNDFHVSYLLLTLVLGLVFQILEKD